MSNDGEKGFTLRGMVVAIAVSMTLCVVGQYIAISLGMMPWSTVLVAIVVMALLRGVSRIFGSSGAGMNEIVVTQAAGSVGILMGAGVAFVLPGLWYVKDYATYQVPIWTVGLLAAVGGLLGVLISNAFRQEFIEAENLPFPAGKAAGDVLKAGDEGGHKARIVLIVGTLTGIFAILRDKILPQSWNPLVLRSLEPRHIYVSFKFSLMSVAGGYLLGPYYSTTWFLGSVFAWIFLMPALVKGFAEGGLTDPVSAAHIFRIGMGTGIVIGSGICFLLIGLGPKARQLARAMSRVFISKSLRLPLLAVLGAIVIMCATQVLGIASAIFAVLGVFIMAPLAAKTTGETDIDPMEIFGILVFLFASAFLALPIVEAFYVICIVTIGAGVSGDIMHDYKTAQIMGTDPFQITRMQIISVIAAAIVAGVGLSILFGAYGAWDPDRPETARGIGDPTGSLPAPQSTIVKLFVDSIVVTGSLPNPNAFWGGFAFGFLLQASGSILALLGRRMTISAFSFGIGVFLPMQVSVPIFIGGILRLFTDRKDIPSQRGDLVAASMLGGEGIAGFAMAVHQILPFIA